MTDRSGPTRLELKSDPSIHMILDGAWWPRTRNSATELVGLVTALDAEQAVVGLLMLNPYGWSGRPQRIHVADRTVRIAWIADLDPMVVIGTATRNRRIDLLLMAPAAATQQDNGSLGESIAATTRALGDVEREPAGVWMPGVRAALLILYATFRHHHEDALRASGTHRQILTTTPRLSNAVAQLDRERADIGVLFDRTLAYIAEPSTTIQADRVRAQILTVLDQLARYQRHDSNLLHEADHVDLGGQG